MTLDMYYANNIYRISALLALGLAASMLPASAADVRVGISSKDTYVGMPVRLQIQIRNAKDFDPPVMPTVDGVEIRSQGAPGKSTQITSINGVTTRTSSVTYSYELTPLRVGRFELPAITIRADGEEHQTRNIEFMASKSETGDLLFVEIAGKEKQIYVGQALDLTLKIWLRPYRDSERQLTLSAGDMWQMVSPRSSWGMFQDRMLEMAHNRERPGAKEVIRKDSDGVEHSYYLYQIEATIYPQSPGKIDAEDVHVIVDYPTQLGAARDPFGTFFDDLPGGMPSRMGRDDFPSPFGQRLVVRSTRPIVADAEVDPINVQPIPSEGRPDDYRGAVGEYQIVTEARQVVVKAGDPIELLIGIVGTGPMELVQAPPLDELPELTADFKVPRGPLAGFVQGDRKLFSASIRPRKAGIKEIPAIPFTYFDPLQQKYVTVHSKPVRIHVNEADTLAMDAIVGGQAGADVPSADDGMSPADTSATFHNASDNSVLSNESPRRAIPWSALVVIALPPTIVVGIGIAKYRSDCASLLARWGWGMHRIDARLTNAMTIPEVADELAHYLGVRLKLPSGRGDTSAILGRLRAWGEHSLAVRCERVFQAAQQVHASGVSRPVPVETIKQEAHAVVAGLQSHLLRSRRTPTPARQTKQNGLSPHRVANFLVLAMAMAANSLAAAPSNTSQAALLTHDQQLALFNEANTAYQQALQVTSDDSAEAKQGFADAAAKYELLVDSGIRNSQLFTNTANAYLQAGELGKAIAYYERALAIDPTHPTALTNLQHARRLLASRSSESAEATSVDLNDLLPLANQWLLERIGLRTLGMTALAGWCALWLVIGLRVIGRRFAWKSLATVSALVTVLAASGYFANWPATSESQAIVTVAEVNLREGDGNRFSESGAKLSEGDAVQVVKQRGDWLKVRQASGGDGWLRSEQVVCL
ncbi:BatD family protein [Aeoliella mucimassa]|uniref:Tetratricopeptide repeat protein n=1 Tax=Aeoliella mucimassa TaxID=2527972 RepID=A0A518AQC9_9BACT|nr:BatD family protein [Aeoliella mucimassa]QDU56926.1 Tetratricopeptide repeat protein [Aeoliella mucimassa]